MMSTVRNDRLPAHENPMIGVRADDIRALLDSRPLVVVSNREPYEHRHSGRGIMVHRPASGLAAALDPVLQAVGGTWVAWGSGDADFEVTDGDRKSTRLNSSHHSISY